MDVYKIAVGLSMTSNAAQVLQTLSSKLLGVHAQVNQLQGGLNRLKVALGGAFLAGGSFAALKAMGHLVQHGNDLVKIQRDMAQAGVANVQIQEAYAKAWQMTGKYQNMSAVEVMKMINDARMTFGDQDSATHHIDDFVQMASFLKAYQGGKHAAHSEALLREVNAAMKSGELAGKISPEDMAEHVKQLTAMKVAYGEQLKITQYLAAQRAGGVALRNSSDAFRYGMFPALVQENGPGAGVMLMTAFNKIVAGTGNRTKSLEHMVEIGLLDRRMLEYDKVGRVKGLKDPSAIVNNREAAINFGDWVMKTFKPLLDAKTVDPIRQAQMISAMFPDRNAAKAITEIIQQYRKLAKDAEQMAKARAAMDALGYNAGSWDYQVQTFQTQWTNLLDALGAPMVAKATEMLGKMNAVIGQFSQWAKESGNANLIKEVGEALAWVLGGTLVAGATALLVALGPIPLAIGAVAAAFGYVATHLGRLISLARELGIIAPEKGPAGRGLRSSYGDLDLPKLIINDLKDGIAAAIKAVDWVGLGGTLGGMLVGMVQAGIKFFFVQLPSLQVMLGQALIDIVVGALKQLVPSVMSAAKGFLSDLGKPPPPSPPMFKPGSFDFLKGLNGAPKAAPQSYLTVPSVGPRVDLAGTPAVVTPPKPPEPPHPKWNVIPPPQRIVVEPTAVALNVDGRKLGEAQVRWMTREGNGPTQGSPYFDSTHGTTPVDLALA